jgi:hypothetical protein
MPRRPGRGTPGTYRPTARVAAGGCSAVIESLWPAPSGAGAGQPPSHNAPGADPVRNAP